jgi:DNA polymerase-3 subunit epsilon
LWPQLPASGRTHTRGSAAKRREAAESFIAKVISRLPTSKQASPKECEYLGLLDRILEDRRVTPEEANDLFELAGDYGIGREQAIDLHRRYLSDLVATALADGVITESEERDIEEVRRALSLTHDDYKKCLLQKPTVTVQSAPQAHTFQGKTVCFTGELGACYQGEPISRAMAERLATESGMDVRKGVTKNLDFLVVADPDSMSSKAKKARAYGVRVIAEAVFWKMIGVHTD